MTLICLMSLLSLKKLKSPSLAPKSSRAFMCNVCSCLVHMPPVSDFSQPAPQPSRFGSVYIVVSIGWQLFQTFGGCHNIIFPPSEFFFGEI